MSHIDTLKNRTIDSIFFGGGTPNLFPPHCIHELLEHIRNHANVADDCEITLEANPGSHQHDQFNKYMSAGVNRFSIGCQSFNDDSLKKIGRIHNSKEALNCINHLPPCNANIDIMHSLPSQTATLAMKDLTTAIDLNTNHLSWYELTIEPNTLFAKRPPQIPHESILDDIYDSGLKLLSQAGFHRYEISAYCKPGFQCRHNLHYWNFDDYIGIGAGASSKLTLHQEIMRFNKIKSPQLYMQSPKTITQKTYVDPGNVAFEYWLNRSRLLKPIVKRDFEEKTFQKIDKYHKTIDELEAKELITSSKSTIYITDKGYQYLNILQEAFLPHDQ